MLKTLHFQSRPMHYYLVVHDKVAAIISAFFHSPTFSKKTIVIILNYPLKIGPEIHNVSLRCDPTLGSQIDAIFKWAKNHEQVPTKSKKRSFLSKNFRHSRLIWHATRYSCDILSIFQIFGNTRRGCANLK